MSRLGSINARRSAGIVQFGKLFRSSNSFDTEGFNFDTEVDPLIAVVKSIDGSIRVLASDEKNVNIVVDSHLKSRRRSPIILIAVESDQDL
jgi:hypothetical protein